MRRIHPIRLAAKPRQLLVGLLAFWLGLLALPASADDYRLGAGDLLRLSVAGYPELGNDLRVSESGRIQVPYVGEVAVAGLSAEEAQRLIAEKLGEGFIRQPQVNLLVLQFQSQQASVLGQVNKPGKIGLQRASRVLDLLAEAGGLATATAADSASILHADGSNAPVDLRALFEGDLRQNLPVRAGDTLFVPKAPQFYIYGEVQHPGVYKLERNMTAAQAISAGGGLSPKGTERGLRVKRRDAGGTPREVRVDVDETLRPDDVLLVQESLF